MFARRIPVKSAEQLERMRAAGLVVARTLELVRDQTVPGVRLRKLDAVAAEHISSCDATPSFLGYMGFPASICVSVGAVAPQAAELIRVTEDALWQGLGAAVAGGRLSDISAAVEDRVDAHGDYGIVEEYYGHGVGRQLHQRPDVANVGPPGRGPRLRPGNVLAIEPILTLGSTRTHVLDDDWTVVTEDGLVAAHFEHTVAVTERGPWVLTALDGGASQLPAG